MQPPYDDASTEALEATRLKKWADAVKKAGKALGVVGFVPIGGKSAARKALYAKTKALLA